MRLGLFACTLLAAAACGSRVWADGCSDGNCQCQACQCDHCPVAATLGHAVGAAHSAAETVVHHPPKHGNRAAAYRSTLTPWHGGYYYTQWGAPVALVIPPNAEMHTDYSWGVPSTRVSWNNHQYQRPFPGAGYGGGYGFQPTPYFPSDTNQYGVYYVRGPW